MVKKHSGGNTILPSKNPLRYVLHRKDLTERDPNEGETSAGGVPESMLEDLSKQVQVM